jgi:hypothetical protein
VAARRGRGAPRPQAGQRDGGLRRRRALIMDFGISPASSGRPKPRRLGPRPPRPAPATATQAGSMVGTVSTARSRPGASGWISGRTLVRTGAHAHDMLSGRIRRTRAPSALDGRSARGPSAGVIHGRSPR